MSAWLNTYWVERFQMTARISSYSGRKVAFLTQHGKQYLVKDTLETALGCQIVHTSDYDTDLLGTFTREVDRTGTQIDAARKKARIGMQLTGANIAIASEGAFGSDPYTGFMAWDTEILLWVDREKGIEITGLAHGPAQSEHCEVKTLQELKEFAIKARFPEHHLVLRPDHQDHSLIFKNIIDDYSLNSAFFAAKEASTKGLVFVENDLRAFCNPTRQEIIKFATKDLIQKLMSTCPRCDCAGYWRTKQISGLLCRSCLNKTRLPVKEIWQCPACSFEQEHTVRSAPFADPSQCDYCNP